MLNHYYNNLRSVFSVLLFLIGLISLYLGFVLDDIPEHQASVVLAIAVITLVLWILAIVTALSMYIYRFALRKLLSGEDNRRYVDRSAENLTPPKNFQKTINSFESLGLKQFAVVDTAETEKDATRLWYWTNDTGTIRAYASLRLFNRVYVGFVSLMGDDVHIETVYRLRMQMDTNSLHMRNVSTSIEAAYHYHLHQVAKYETIHGDAIAIKNASELIDYSNRLKNELSTEVYEARLKDLAQMFKFYLLMALAYSACLLFNPGVNIFMSSAIANLLIVVYLALFDIEHNKNAFGSVEGRKKKKNS